MGGHRSVQRKRKHRENVQTPHMGRSRSQDLLAVKLKCKTLSHWATEPFQEKYWDYSESLKLEPFIDRLNVAHFRSLVPLHFCFYTRVTDVSCAVRAVMLVGWGRLVFSWLLTQFALPVRVVFCAQVGGEAWTGGRFMQMRQQKESFGYFGGKKGLRLCV